MKLGKTLSCLLAIAMLAVAVSVTPALAQLANPGFEDPITYNGPPFVGSWEGFFGGDPGFVANSQNSTLMPLTGLQSLELSIGPTINTFAGAFQDVPGLTAGQIGTFGGWHKSLGSAGGIEIRIEWRNSVSNTEISRTPNLSPTPGSTYEQFTLSAPVPAGADTARVTYAIQSFGAPPDQLVYVDDTSFFVPEPACATLLVLVGLTLGALRRR